MAAETGSGVSGNQLVDFINGETLRQYTDLLERTELGVDEQTRLAKLVERGVVKDLAAALREVLAKEPELATPVVVRRIDALARPRHKHADLLDACIEADVPAYLHGEAGSGKSTAAENAAAMRGVPIRAVSLSPTTSKADLLGYNDATGKYNRSGFREIWDDGGIYLFDEIDNSNPSVLALMNRALSGFVNEFPDGAVERNRGTRILAAANTIGRGATAQYVGRSPIDAATLDRFAMIPWDIDPYLENELMKVGNPAPPRPLDIDRGGIPSRQEWLDEVRGFRERAALSGLRVVISTRSAIYGAKLAEQGVGTKWLEEMLIFKGMADTDRAKLSPRY